MQIEYPDVLCSRIEMKSGRNWLYGFLQKVKKKPPRLLVTTFLCGGGAIRTPSTFQYDGFQDRSIQPIFFL